MVTARSNGPLRGRVRVPGEASISHLALVLAGLASGRTGIAGLAHDDDVEATLLAMRAMGARIEQEEDGWTVHGTGNGSLMEPEEAIHLGLHGAHLVLGLAGAYDFTTTILGHGSIRARSMGAVLDPLRRMGAQVLARSRDRLPLTVRGPRFAAPLSHQMSVPSAKAKSAILLAGLNTPGITSVIEAGATSDQGERMLQGFGAQIEIESGTGGERIIRLAGQSNLRGVANVVVPGDPSSAALLVVAALVVPGSDVVVENVSTSGTHTGLFETLLEMGASIAFENPRNVAGLEVADLHVRHSALKGVSVPPGRVAPTGGECAALAVAAAFADGTTRIEDLHETHGKEADHRAALAAALAANGIAHEAGETWLQVTGQPDGRGLGGGTLATHLASRIAMSFLVLGLAGEKPVTAHDGDREISARLSQFAGLVRNLGGTLEQREV